MGGTREAAVGYHARGREGGHRMRPQVWIVAAALGAWGCSEEASVGVTSRADAAATPDAVVDAAARDAEPDGAREPADAAPPPACAPRVPRSGGSAIAERPARCGQPEFAWLDDERLGEVTAAEPVRDFTAARLDEYVRSIGLEPPKPATHDVRLWRIVYRSQDRGVSVEASALVAAPVVEPGGEPLEVILYLHNALGFDDRCPPTGLEEDGTPTGFVITAAQWAGQGRLVVMPDLLGIKSLGEPGTVAHPFLVGQASALVALDGVRALNHLPDAARGDTGCPSARFLAYGPAHGGHAALWVDRLAPHYAAELRMVGAVGTAVPLDLRAEAQAVLSGERPENGLGGMFLALAGLWYGRADAVDGLYAEAPDDWLATVRDSCDFNATRALLAGQATLSPEAATALAEGDGAAPWACIADENGLVATSVARLPTPEGYGILLIYGDGDDTTLVDASIQQGAVETLCAQGMPIRGHVCAGEGQWLAGFRALRLIDRFIDDRFADRPLTGNCGLPGAVSCGP